ncbi:uncharacterized protein PGTG_21239 [Puccinia graminis f. sp. tritici CRL 75-36-700-3]|uniref:Uncharacterized protein n=1 Tax=Puccinia graminis f. sp. tritici (strain CRL 75-36-700-3 / race SCCL) TaxID=418459 RepID=H6QQQ9_PUCGT|nr:uncharacterized protein PGTG_21239 [Puccinia graminis f. sp. tritici CRL 75-36-700-3]EHS62777.1 hypothetical protein PGTG_21239 [Puccinia graminis f. sp. tritici CRL 75-36-700-3]
MPPRTRLKTHATHDQDRPVDTPSPPDQPHDDNEKDAARTSSEEPSSPRQVNHPLTDAEELERARRVAANAVSSSYNNYQVPELSDQKDKSGRFMIAYHCKIMPPSASANNKRHPRRALWPVLGLLGLVTLIPKRSHSCVLYGAQKPHVHSPPL